MKLLLDQGTPRSAVNLLRQAGFDVIHASEIGMAESDDIEILNRALADGRVVVTLDADFHRHLVMLQASQPSVIRIRIEGLRAAPFSELIQNVIHQCSDDLKTGAMISVTDLQIRVRRLPVV